ncbi:hypothetical protein EJB05_27234, partial [Eragrostis curvula]
MHKQDSHRSRPPVTHAVSTKLTSDGSSSVVATSPDPSLCDARTRGERGIDGQLLLPLQNYAGMTPCTVFRFPLPACVCLVIFLQICRTTRIGEWNRGQQIAHGYAPVTHEHQKSQKICSSGGCATHSNTKDEWMTGQMSMQK